MSHYLFKEVGRLFSTEESQKTLLLMLITRPFMVNGTPSPERRMRDFL
jgi:hypothetical protein